MKIDRQATTTRWSQLAQLLIAARPRQWGKNLLVFAPLVFAQQATLPKLWGRAVLAFFLLSLAASAVYLLNDVIDAERDRLHAGKSQRPVASRSLGLPLALLGALSFAALAMGLSGCLSKAMLVVIGTYLFLATTYCLGAKHVVILDVFILAAGFVLRAIAGGVSTGIPLSHWLILCLSFLALFLALCKRRGEIIHLGRGAVQHRPVLGSYTPELLDQLITIAVIGALMSYVLYTVSAETINRLGSHAMMLTIPFVGFGLMRYLLIARRPAHPDQPDDLILNDAPLLLNLAAYVIVIIMVLY